MSDLHVRFKAYDSAGVFQGFLQPSSWSASVQHNDAGTLSMTYPRVALNGDILKRGLEQGLEIGMEVATHDGTWVEPYNCRFLLVSRSRDAQDHTDTVTLNCMTWIWLTKKILNLNMRALLTDTGNNGKRPFYSATSGMIVHTLLDENRTRGGAATVMPAGFNSARDTNGDTWAYKMTLYYDAGIDLYTVIDNLSANGMCDWRTDGRMLKMWNADSTALCRDLSARVRIPLATGLESPEEETIEGLAGNILIRGDDGLVFTQENPAAPTPWGKWELYSSQGGVSNKDTAQLMMQTQLAAAARVRGQYTRQILTTGIEHLPLVDYRPGDWITAPTVTHGEKVRVQRVELSNRNDGGVKCALMLNDRLYDAQTRQAKRIQGITGGAVAGGASGAAPAPEKDHRVPMAPTGLVVQTDAYLDANGYARGLATAQWAGVTQATNHTSIEIDSYRVEWRPNTAGEAWRSAGVTTNTTLSWGNLDCGTTIQVRVRAVPTYSDKLGDWSAVTFVDVAQDVTPPSVPSTPQLASETGIVTIHWDGNTADGGRMELDFDHVEVGRGTGANNIAVIAATQSGAGDYLDTTLSDGDTRYYALRAVDHAGNRSDWSTPAQVTCHGAVSSEDLDQINQTIAANKQVLDQTNKELAEVKDDVADAKTDIAANKTALATANTELDGVKTDLASAKSSIKANTDALAAANREISQTQTELTTAKTDIATNKSAITAAKSELTETSAALKETNKTLGQTQTELATAKTDIATNKSALATANQELSTVKTDVANAKQQAANAAQQAGAAVSAANSAAQQAGAAVSTAGTAVDAAASAVDVANKAAQSAANSAAQTVVSSTIEYAVNNSRETPPAEVRTWWEGEPNNSVSVLELVWSTHTPTVGDGEYAWIRTRIVHGDGSVEYSTPAVITGEAGPQGVPGAPGAAGTPGKDGAPGAAGISVTAITNWYALTLSKPETPTVKTPGSPWSTNEPAYDGQKSLYTSSRIDYSNGQFSWTPVQTSSAYKATQAAETAARDAITTATNAATTADTAKKAAEAAKTDAADAKTTAGNASSVATQANATAASAQQAATSAQTAANILMQQAADLQPNSGFEHGTDYWATNVAGAAFVETSQFAHSGSRRAYLNRGLGTKELIGTQAVRAVTDRRYRLSIWYKLINMGTASAGGLRLQYSTDGKNWADTNAKTEIRATTGDGWAYSSCDLVATSSTPLLRARLAYNQPVDMYVDDFRLQDITEAWEAQQAADTAQATAAQAKKDAANADAKAVSAAAAAAGAQTTADSKSTVYTQPDEPLHDNLTPGDVWRRTSTKSPETYWLGTPNDSVSVLVIHADEVEETLVWNGTRFTSYYLFLDSLAVTGSISTDLLAANAVTAEKIKALAITTDKLAANAVNADKIAANAVTADKIKAGSVVADKIAANAITVEKIAANAITSEKISANAVTATKIAALAVNADKIAANAITAEKIAALAITAEKIAANAITTDKLAANAVNADKLAANAITAEKIAANAVTAEKIKALAITTDKLAANAVNADKLAANAVTADKIKAGSVVADKLAANAVTTAKIAALAVNADKIAANAITAEKIAALAITADKIASGTITSDKIKSGQFVGYVFTGAVFQSHTEDNKGFKLRDGALDMWNANGDKTVHLDGEGNENILVGTLQTALSGDRIVISPKFSTTTIGSDQYQTGSGISFPLSGTYAMAPYIATESNDSLYGAISTITINGGMRTDGSAGAGTGFGSFMRIGQTRNASTKTEMASVYMTANCDYLHKSPDTSRREWRSSFSLSQTSGDGSRAEIAARKPNAWAQLLVRADDAQNNGATWLQMSASVDNKKPVGILANSQTGILHLGGYLGGMDGRATFVASWSENSSNTLKEYAKITHTFGVTPPAYGRYKSMVSLDSDKPGCYWSASTCNEKSGSFQVIVRAMPRHVMVNTTQYAVLFDESNAVRYNLVTLSYLISS